MSEKILIGMSGGVDSSAAALLLKRQGYEVAGVTLDLLDNSTLPDDAARVAHQIGIEHYVLNLKDTFRQKVMEPFADEYFNGRTPNPCVLCNCEIKFGAMLDFALEKGFDKIATGHYGEIITDEKGVHLKKSSSPKDQSYFLSMLTPFQLSHAIFPLNSMTKDETRALAKEAGLSSAEKKDSQEICFIPDNDYGSFLTKFTGRTPEDGNFVDESGNILGRHKGIIHYTIGQRKGLGVTFGKPMFVIGINPRENTVTLGENGAQYSSKFTADKVNIIEKEYADKTFEAYVKIRCQAKPAKALVTLKDDGTMTGEFIEPQRSVTLGQLAAVYADDFVVAGGRIISVEK